MRLVFVNHCPPCLPHVCAVRVRCFAEAAARAGHRVVLLTEAPAGAAGDDAAGLRSRLDAWDGTEPLAVGIRPHGHPWTVRARQGRLPAGPRQAVLAASYLAKGGVFPDWSDAARPVAQVLGKHFRPDVVWASFGNTDAWTIARQVAGAAACPWVADVKDPLGAFIPAPVRRRVAARFADAAAVTALSAAHAGDAQAVLGRAATVVRSGIDDGFLPPPGPPDPDWRIMVQGALYDGGHLAALVEGLRRWLSRLPEAGQVVLAYAGGEADRFRDAARGLPCRVEARGFLPLADLRAEMARASVLAYVRAPRALVQHKLVELAAMDRPILCLPEESGEARGLAGGLGALLVEAADEDAAAAAFAELWARRPAPRCDRAALARLSWDAQCRVLAGVLEAAR